MSTLKKCIKTYDIKDHKTELYAIIEITLDSKKSLIVTPPIILKLSPA
jgi:hypothetical protein